MRKRLALRHFACFWRSRPELQATTVSYEDPLKDEPLATCIVGDDNALFVPEDDADAAQGSCPDSALVIGSPSPEPDAGGSQIESRTENEDQSARSLSLLKESVIESLLKDSERLAALGLRDV